MDCMHGLVVGIMCRDHTWRLKGSVLTLVTWRV